MLTRRRFAQFAALVSMDFTVAGAAAADRGETLERAFAAIEATSGGRLGVAVLDASSGETLGYRLDERFPLCSTGKALTVGAILARADAGRLSLDTPVAIVSADLLSYAPVAKAHVGGAMSIAELCDAAITLSDNTAANLLFAALGGPSAVTDFVRTLGDAKTRLDRTEPDLNEATPGDPRDTTTPRAMARTLADLTTKDSLSAASREKLVNWLIGCKTGAAKLRAGLPPSWRVGDKTGSGGRGASNDVAVVWPPNRPPIVLAAYLAETDSSDAIKNAAHAAVGRAVAEAWG